MSQAKVAQAVVEVLQAQGVKFVFGLPGAHTAPIYDALIRTPQIRHIQVRHEQSAANMAAAYAQLTGEPGVCTATAGPGATNLATGIAEAFVGAFPLVALTGRAMTGQAGRGAQQDIPQDLMFAPITKWTVKVDRPDKMVETLRLAFVKARSGKPGPVVVDIPWDILLQETGFDTYEPLAGSLRPRGDVQVVKAAVEKLLHAGRPVLVAGGGAVRSGAFAELRQLAETLGIPVLTSLSGRSAIGEDHPLAAGGLGLHRNRISKRLLAEADFVLGLGVRFEQMDSNRRPGFVPAAEASYVKVDADPAEMASNVLPDIGIVGDIKLVLADMLELIKEMNGPDYRDTFRDLPRVKELIAQKEQLEAEVRHLAATGTRPLQPLAVITAIQEVFPRPTVIATDIGGIAQAQTVYPYLKADGPGTCITPGSLFAMGFAASALPVAKLVHPEKPAVGICGDGSFQMVMNVLPVAAQYRLPVTWCIMNDQGFGSIADVQKTMFNSRFTAIDFQVQPDFALVARACKCYGERVEEPDQIHAALARAFEANEKGTPAVLDFLVARERTAISAEYFGNS